MEARPTPSAATSRSAPASAPSGRRCTTASGSSSGARHCPPRARTRPDPAEPRPPSSADTPAQTHTSVYPNRPRPGIYSAPMFVTAEFINNTTGEIKSQTVFMGDFPLMSPKGTFIINGTERVVVSQLVRSPGVYFDRQVDKTSDKDIFSCKVIPSRGAWLEFEIDKRDSVGVRIDRKRKQSVTVLLKALGWDEAK